MESKILKVYTKNNDLLDLSREDETLFIKLIANILFSKTETFLSNEPQTKIVLSWYGYPKNPVLSVHYWDTDEYGEERWFAQTHLLKDDEERKQIYSQIYNLPQNKNPLKLTILVQLPQTSHQSLYFQKILANK